MTDACRTATLRTDHRTPTRAEWVAKAVSPDNTDSMSTAVDESAVETRIERKTTGGLGTTADDYIVNLGVATAVIDAVERRTPTPEHRTVADQQTDNTYHE